MYALIQDSGFQYKIRLGEFVKLPKLSLSKGSIWKCTQVLAFQGVKGPLVIGSPFVSKMEVTGRILRHGKYKKVLVFKKKRRKGYRRTQGHRQEFTEVYVESFTDPEGRQVKKALVKKSDVNKETGKKGTSKMRAPDKRKKVASV